MKNDPILRELHQIRAKLSAETPSLKALFKRGVKLQCSLNASRIIKRRVKSIHSTATRKIKAG